MSDAVQAQVTGLEARMKPLDPRQIWVVRIHVALTFLFILVAVIAIDRSFAAELGAASGVAPLPLLAIAVLAIIFMPGRRYRAWGFVEEDDELHIRHGLWIRVQTAVPFGRVQHIDVAQGPIERRFGLARLILHTAGTRSAAIPLPGLAHSDAEAMRDRIRSKIRQDLG